MLTQLITYVLPDIVATGTPAMQNYYRAKAEKERVRQQKRRAKKQGLPADLTWEQWLETLDLFNWSCAYCYGPLEALDHLVPISLGGGTIQGNCVPACAKCNAKKSNMNPTRFVQYDSILAKIQGNTIDTYLARAILTAVFIIVCARCLQIMLS